MRHPISSSNGDIGLKIGSVLGSLFKESRITKTDLLGEFGAYGITPPDSSSKQAVVRTAMREADDLTAKQLTARLVRLLASEGLFASDEPDASDGALRLKEALSRMGASMSEAGYVNWDQSPAPEASRQVTPASLSQQELPYPQVPHPRPMEHYTPAVRSFRPGTVPLAHDDVVAEVLHVLARIPQAAHSLTHKPRGRRAPISITNEYDTQDFVFQALRLRFDRVIDEEPIGQTGGKGFTKGDFYLSEHKIMVEVKVAKHGHGVKDIKSEIAADQADYRDDVTVQTLIPVVYDLSQEIVDKVELQRHLDRGPKTRSLIIDWPTPASLPKES